MNYPFLLFVFVGPLLLVLLHAPPTSAWAIDKALLQWFQNSNLAADLHAKHVASDTATHMMKGTPLVDAPGDDKMAFASGPGGKVVEGIMVDGG